MAKKTDARARPRRRPADLREACVEEALAIVGESGLEALSLREVARRLHVSHQAPYKHFASRDHILAEVVGRAFAGFARYLDARPRSADPMEDLAQLGLAYLGFARTHPLHYRLMFGTPLPDPGRHPEMMKQARHAFAILLDGVARLHGRPADTLSELDALFVWASMHGLAGILQSHALQTLDLEDSVLGAAIPHALLKIRFALDGDERAKQAPPRR